MKVRNRLLLAIGLTMAFTAVGVHYVAAGPMMDSFLNLEDGLDREAVIRVRQSFVSGIDVLHGRAVNWSNRDDTYKLMGGTGSSPTRAGFTELAMADLHVGAAFFLKDSKTCQYSLLLQKGGNTDSLSAQSVLDQLQANGYLSKISPQGPGESGIIMSQGVPVAVSIRPIHNSDGGGGFRGWLVLARRMDWGALGELRDLTRQDVTFLSPTENQTENSETRYAIESLRTRPFTLRPIDEDNLIGYSAIRDIHGNLALVLKSTMPRPISKKGAAMAGTVTSQLLAIGAFLSIVIMVVLDRFALKRLSKLSNQVEDIAEYSEGQRVSLTGRDELSYLAERINDMLGKLDLGAQKLRANEDVLRAHNENLELKVIQRTQVIEHQAFHDSLTELPNRALFMDRLSFALQRLRRVGCGVAVLFIDLDNFKLVNDSLGHDVGDELLMAVAKRLCAAVRAGDTVARLGGDEFTILLEDIHSLDEASTIADEVLASLKLPIALGPRETFACASIGLAFTSDPELSGVDLLKNADTAMYRSKAGGKSSCTVFDRSMEEYAIERLEFETDLRKAMDMGQMAVHFQPLIDLRTNELKGSEALARWMHPHRGLVMPSDFIPVAEETGLIIPMGYWVLEQACAQAKLWRERGDLDKFVISVNLSGRQLQQDDVVERVQEVLERTGLPPSGLKLEITESILMTDQEEVIKKMMKLKELGVQLALDDFGTGYSSLSTLSAFPIDTLKIDRAFISRIGHEDQALAIIQAIIAIARTMRMDVTGEGVETRLQERTIFELGCHTGQGFLYDEALTAKDFALRFQALGGNPIIDRWAA